MYNEDAMRSPTNSPKRNHCVDSLQAAIDVNLNALVHDLHDRNQAIARVEKQIELEARLLGDLNDSMTLTAFEIVHSEVLLIGA